MNKYKFVLAAISLIIILPVSQVWSNRPAKRGFSETPVGKSIPITGNIEQLKYFFDALSKTNSQKIRIGHYGDSIIWGDVITDHLRNYYQKKYGGHGLGFISICTDDIAARKTVIHRFSDDWDWASVFTKNRNKYPIGIAGTVGKADEGSKVSYQSMKLSPTADSFSEVEIYYSNTKSSSSVNYWVDGGNKKVKSLKKSSGLEVTKLNLGPRKKKIELEFENSKDAYFYGVTLESGNGIYIDNFPFRGNSGVGIREISDKLLAGFAKNLEYKLFILQFGVNIAASGNVKYKWYERMMLNVIKKIKKYFPETSILIISPGDLMQKKGRIMQTHPEIKRFVAVQEKIAEKGGVAFWNMFEAMGGENSISNWVEAKPPLAFKDYCHLTWAGGEIIANKLVSALLAAKSK
ncbi:MAG: hypothetical protein L3J41_01665 [Melioribacteraceae bacterium]|nr:hypothetical protein [Melioribacteraceae bacterium]